MSKVSHLAKNTGVLAVGTFSAKVLTFLLVPIYTAALSTAEYGSYDIVYSTCTLLVPILTFNVSEAMMRFPLQEGADVPRIARIGMSITLASGAVVLFVELIPGPWRSIDGYLWAAPLYLVYALYQELLFLARGTEHFKAVAIAGIVSSAFVVALTVLLLFVAEAGLDGFFAANVCGMAMGCAYLLFKLRGILFARATSHGGDLARRMVVYSLPLCAATVGWWLVSTSGRYIVLYFCGASENGLYSVASKIPAILSVIAGVFIQAWQVSGIKEMEGDASRGDNSFLLSVFDAAEALVVLLCSLLCLLSPAIALVMFSNDFYVAWEYVPLLLVFVVFNTMAGMWGPVFSAHYDTRPIAASTAMAGVANVALGIPLTYLFGVQGMAFAGVLAGLVNWGWRGYKVRRHTDADFHMGRSLIVYAVLIAQAFIVFSPLPFVARVALQLLVMCWLVWRFRTIAHGICASCTRLVRGRRRKGE